MKGGIILKFYSAEIIYVIDGQVIKDYFEDITHVTYVSSSLETTDVESFISNRLPVKTYYSLASKNGRYDFFSQDKLVSVKFY